MMKTCNKCNIEKSLDEFVFDNSKKQYTAGCKECRRIIQKKKRDDNRAEYNAKTTEWRSRTIERQKENRLSWRNKNVEKVNELERARWKKRVDDEHLEYFLVRMENND